MSASHVGEHEAALASAPVATWLWPEGAASGAHICVVPKQVASGMAIWQSWHAQVPQGCCAVAEAMRQGQTSVTHSTPIGVFITSWSPSSPACATVVCATLYHRHPPSPRLAAASAAIAGTNDAQPPSSASADSAEIDLAPLLAHAPAAIAVLTQEGQDLVYRFTNATYGEFVGHPSLTGRTLGAAFADAGESAPEILQIERILRRVVETGERFVAKQHPLCLDWQHNGQLTLRHYDVVCAPLPATAHKARGVMIFAYDVSAQVLAREQAEKSGAYFRHMADCLPQIVWTATPAGHLDWYNARWYAFRGLRPTDATANDWSVVVHPDDAERCAAQWATSLRTCGHLNMECRFRDVLGAYRWFLVRATPMFNADGTVSRWFGSATDVHEERGNQRVLDEILEAMHDGFFCLDAQWRILRVNARHEELSRTPRAQLVGKDFLDMYFRTENERKSSVFEKYQTCMAERLPVGFVDYFPERGMWLALNLYPSDDGGIAVFYRDCSAEQSLLLKLKAETQKFEAIFSDSPAYMALLRGPTHIFEKANPKYMELLGQRELIGKPLYDAIPEIRDQGFIEEMGRVFATGEPYIAEEMLIPLVRTRGGGLEDGYYTFTYTRVLDGNGVPYGVYIHAVEVTQQLLARWRVEEIAGSLQEAISARDEFLSSASHELKTPVTSIKMQLQMTRRAVKPEQNLAPPPQKLAKTLDLCVRQVNRLAALIEDLLDVSRIEAGKMTFEFAPVDLAQLACETLEQFAEQLAAAGCTLHIDAPTAAIAVCDSFRIEQVLINLITNAIKYGAKSAVQFTVKPQQGGVRIEVADGGMGIAADKLEAVFARFERAVTHHNVSGLGLGLYICKQIVEAHGGRIGLTSTLGQGSCFTVDLPDDARPTRPIESPGDN